MSHSREVNASLRYALLRNVPKPSEGLFYPWNIDFVSRDQDRLLALGWAAPLDGLPDNTVIYCNGKPAVSTWSADEAYHRLLPNWHGAANSGFGAAWPDFVVSDDDVLTFEIRAADGSKLPEKHELKFRFADQAIVRCPNESLIAHIGRLSPMSFVLTGRTLATHFDRLLRSFSGSGFGGAQSVLDWGCGSARVAQHVARELLREGSTLRGIDVDSTAIEWCSSNLKGIRFQTCGLHPPTDIPDNSTDIVYAYSVLTHLRKADAEAWIAEIRRILKPSGHFVFTTLGTLSLGWLYPLGDSAIASALEGPGIYDVAKNTDIDETILDQEYYRNTWVTEDYVRTKWSDGFEVLGFEPCFHYYQDAWVFRKKAGPARRAVGPMRVAIAGMHRSGTSMVTRLLNLCGLYLGEEEDVVYSRKDNPQGFWENAKFRDTNDEILASFGGGWDIPPVLEPGWENSAHLAALNRHAREVIEEISQEPVWGWKDPRNSLTLPFWKRLIPDLKIVICLRNPVDVHRSLAHRGYASSVFSYNLWLTYYQQLIASTKPEDCIITHYDSFFCDPRAELRRLADFLKLDVSKERIQTASQATLTDLRHHRATVSDFGQMNVPHKVIELYKELCLRAGPTNNGPLSLDEPLFPQNVATIEESTIIPVEGDSKEE